MSHFFSTFINRSLLNVHYVRRLWEAASDTAFSAPNCWYSCSCVTTPSPQVWAGLSDSLWTNRIWHKWQDVTTMTEDCNLSRQHSLLVAFSCLLTCLLWCLSMIERPRWPVMRKVSSPQLTWHRALPTPVEWAWKAGPFLGETSDETMASASTLITANDRSRAGNPS